MEGKKDGRKGSGRKDGRNGAEGRKEVRVVVKGSEEG